MTAGRQIGLAHLSAIDLPPMALIDLAAETGCGSVALRLHPAAPGTPVYPLASGSDEIRRLKAHASDRQVLISEAELVPIETDLDLDTLRPMLAAAVELDAKGLIVTGDIDDPDLMTERFALLCDLAGEYGLKVHLEFMRWRSVGTLGDAMALLQRADRDNAYLLIDLLHLVRSGGSADDLALVPRERIDIVQICDAEKELRGDIIAEARSGRLAIGQGALPIRQFLAHLPPDCAFALEIPTMGEASDRRSLLKNSRQELLRMLAGT